jgi:hypothetical protein
VSTSNIFGLSLKLERIQKRGEFLRDAMSNRQLEKLDFAATSSNRHRFLLQELLENRDEELWQKVDDCS